MHVALVAPRYFVGSFDDDSAYILAAKALLRGVGLDGRLPSGEVVVGLFPPGYSAVLAPLLWIWPHSFVPLRLLSVACYAGLFPLTWVWLARKGVTRPVATAALFLLALGPPLATYGSMVMAETPFLVVLVLLLMAVEGWATQSRVLTWTGASVVALSAGLIWLKQAGIGVVAGLVLWFVLHRSARHRARAAILAACVGVTLVPVVVARMAAAVPIAGGRYSQELGGYYQGGLVRRLVDVVPHSTWHLLATAVPATLVPYLEPLPIAGHWASVWKIVSWQVTVLAVVGAILWARRHRDAAIPMVVVYLAESVLWPFVNERRAILVLPVLTAWYVTGAAATWSFLRQRLSNPAGERVARAAGVSLVAVAVVAPLVAQIPRDYLFGWGQTGSHFGGSRYAALLGDLGRPSDVVETDYRSSTALFTGHATAWSAFTWVDAHGCDGPGLRNAMASDGAGFLLLGDVNKPGRIDSPCIRSEALLGRWAVQMLYTGRDDASVYELIGPGTGHPGLVDVLSDAGPGRYSTAAATTTLSWDLSRPTELSQLSVGEAAADGGPTTDVRLEVRDPGGIWVTVARSATAVGDGRGRAPFLLSRLGSMTVTGVRVVVDGGAAGEPAAITDVVALGPGAAPS